MSLHLVVVHHEPQVQRTKGLLGMHHDARLDLALEIDGRRHISSQRQMGKSDYLQHQLEY
jgi:hypothetical protein